MDFSRINALAGRIIHQMRRDHRTLAMIFVVPILVLSLLGYLIRSQDSSTLHIGLVNGDSGVNGISAAATISAKLKENTQLLISEVSRDSAEADVRDGSLDAALVFPADFTARLLNKQGGAVELILEGSNPSKTASVSGALQGALMQAALGSGLGPAAAQTGGSGLPISVTPDLLYGSTDLTAIDYLAPIFIGFFVFFLVFLLTCISFLRERTQGTMERLAASPITRLELVLGYMFGFGIFALLQSAVIMLFTVYVLQVKYAGNLSWAFVVTLMLAIGAVNLGIFLSTFARTELQAVQFIPIVIVPQALLCGILWPVASMPDWLQALAHVLPLTYANAALTDIMVRGLDVGSTGGNLLVLLGFALALVLLAAVTLRRKLA